MGHESKPAFFRLSEAEALHPAEGVEIRGVFGEGASLSIVALRPGAVVELHSHPHEQIGFVIDGVEILVIDGVEHHLHANDGYVIPGGVPHAGWGGPDGCVVLDVFVPLREEYRSSAAPARPELPHNGS